MRLRVWSWKICRVEVFVEVLGLVCLCLVLFCYGVCGVLFGCCYIIVLLCLFC